MRCKKEELLAAAKELRRSLKEAKGQAESDAERRVITVADLALRDYAKQLRDGKQYDAEFVALWESYPRKVGKDKAYTAYKKVVKGGATQEQLTRAVRDWSQTDQWNRGYVPYMANWLNDGKWQEDTRCLPKAKQTQYLEREADTWCGVDPTEI